MEWNLVNANKQSMVDMLAKLLKQQRGQGLVDKDEDNYGRDLFDYFCKHKDRQHITIQGFTSLPPALYQSLFTGTDVNKLSFIPITKIFPYLTELLLNNLNMSDLLPIQRNMLEPFLILLSHRNH